MGNLEWVAHLFATRVFLKPHIKIPNNLIDEMNNSTYYVDYLLNFGNNEQYLAVNVFLNRAIEGYEIHYHRISIKEDYRQ